MSETKAVRFEEAEEKKWKILLYTAIFLTTLAWIFRSSGITVALVTGLGIYLMTGDRYQWIYIFRKTFYRDLLGLTVLVKTTTRMRLWEQQGTTVVSRWAEICQRSPDKKAFVMDDRFITFQDGDHLSNRIAWYFKRQGFKRGEVIALFMETQPDYTFLWLGLAKIGVISALVNSNLRGSQLTHCLRVAKCKALIFGDEMSCAIKEVQSDLKDMPMFQYGTENVPIHPAVALTTEIKDMPTETIIEDFGVKPRDTLLYIYTSGTTGFPKAAVITNIRYLLIPSGVYASAGLNSSDVIYDPLPLHHTAGGVLGAGQALIFGCTVVLRKKFSASNYWSDAAKYGCTAAQYIGEICRYVLSVPPSESDTNHKVRVILGNGLRPQIWEKFIKRFNVPRVLEFYGATEGNSNLINLDSKVGAIGFLSRMASSIYPLTLVKCDEITGEIYRDKNGRCIVCGPFEPGLFLGKIDSRKAILTFSGYADRTASEKKMVRDVRVLGDCYFNTGDILVMDHFGYFYFKDRTGDTFRWKGENVSTAEVEGLLSNIVGLKDTIVYGVKVPHVEGKAGMVSIADPDNQLDLEALSNAVKTLPVYSRPLFLRILPEPPITATFKLKKKELIEQNYDRNVLDPLYFLEPKSGRYVRLTDELYQSIVSGDIKL